MFSEENTTLLPVGVPPAFLPGAYYNPLPNATRGNLMTPRIVILHTNAGGSSSGWRNLFTWSNRVWDAGDRSVTQPHLQIQRDGVIGQGLPFDRVGVHARYANLFAIGIETQDSGTREMDVTREPWTPAQIDSIVRAITHICIFYPSVKVAIPDAWDGSGISFHAQFGYPMWSKYPGKVCPGAARIWQVIEIHDKVKENVRVVKELFGV